MLRAALYARTSTTGNGQDIELQMEELRQLCLHCGYRIVSEYLDEGVSGAKGRRPGLDAMLQQAQRGRVDVVVVWKLDRLGRSLRHLLDTLAALDGWGGQFVSARDPGIDSTSPTGRLLTQLLGAFAEFEREMIRERVNAGVARAQRKGVHCGRPRLAVDADDARAAVRAHGGIAQAARALGVSRATLRRRLTEADSGGEE